MLFNTQTTWSLTRISPLLQEILLFVVGKYLFPEISGSRTRDTRMSAHAVQMHERLHNSFRRTWGNVEIISHSWRGAAPQLFTPPPWPVSQLHDYNMGETVPLKEADYTFSKNVHQMCIRLTCPPHPDLISFTWPLTYTEAVFIFRS